MTSFDESTVEEKKKFGEKHKNVGLFAYLVDEIPYHEKVDSLGTKFRFPGYFLAGLIAFNIAGLIFADAIHNCIPKIEILILGIVGVMHAFAFVVIVYKIQSILKR